MVMSIITKINIADPLKLQYVFETVLKLFNS